jgi:hypothetical protein
MNVTLHPRTIIRNALGVALINRSEAYKDRVFLQRAVKLDGANDLPCVAIYTNSDSQKDELSYGKFKRELEIEINIYHKRIPNLTQAYQSVRSMPVKPVNYDVLAQDLDSICLDVETLLIEFFKKGSVEYNNQKLFLDNAIEINTKIEQDDGGDNQYSVAILQVTCYYYIDLNVEIDYCCFNKAIIEINNLECLKQCT